MLTIFACPKSFTDPHIAIIQRNAITSWTLLEPRPEIILFGGEPYEFGVAEICQELGLRHVPEVERNQYGTPLLSDLFLKAEQLASHDLLAYVNADIILMGDFMRAVECVARLRRRFLLVGRRWDLDVKECLTFESGWEERLRARAQQEGRLYPPKGIDYFVFPRGLWGAIPPFALGRTAWDNWLLFRARKMGACLIDATPVVMAIHQNHGYSAGEKWVWKGPEAQRNRELTGGPQCWWTLQDATHRLTLKGIELWLPGLLRLHARWSELRHQWCRWIWYPLLATTRPLRHRLGLKKETVERWKAYLR